MIYAPGENCSTRTPSVCSGCELVRVGGKDCQRAKWKSHTRACKLSKSIPADSKKLELRYGHVEDEEGSCLHSFLKVLDYASKYMTKLEEVSVWIDQSNVLGDDLMGYSSEPPRLTLDSENADFFENALLLLALISEWTIAAGSTLAG